MMATLAGSAVDSRILRLIARLWALAALVVWGAFFVEHTVEWFGGGTASPPLWVWMLYGWHLTLLISLLLGWRYELAGGLLTLVSAIVFFGGAAGSRGIPFIAVTIPPALMWIALALARRRP
jgi:hypothetical protein